MRTCIKKVLKFVNTGDKKAAEAAYKEAVPAIDSMVNKGIIHRNKGSRHKSHMNDKIRSMRS